MRYSSPRGLCALTLSSPATGRTGGELSRRTVFGQDLLAVGRYIYRFESVISGGETDRDDPNSSTSILGRHGAGSATSTDDELAFSPIEGWVACVQLWQQVDTELQVVCARS